VDAGPAVSSSAVLQAMRDQRVDRLAFAALSHAHENHFGGFSAVLADIPAEELIWSGTDPKKELADLFAKARTKNVKVRNAAAGPLLNQPIEIEVLHPAKLKGEVHLDSLVLGIRYGMSAFVLAGDLAPAAQAEAASRLRAWLAKKPSRLELVTWPHHGDEIDPAWLQVLQQARYLSVSVGPNEYKMPREDLLAAQGDRVLRTDRQGSFALESDGRLPPRLVIQGKRP
jgi:beta-lactamase superfamily II metal-dependent hydrolase